MNKIKIFRIPTLSSALLKMTIQMDGNIYKIKPNETLEIECSDNTKTLKIGKRRSAQEVKLLFNENNDCFLSCNFNMPKNEFEHLLYPSKAISVDVISESKFNALVEENRDLSLVKQNVINFIDASSIFFSLLLGAFSYVNFRDGNSVLGVISGVTALGIILSILFRKLAHAQISLKGSLLRNLLFCIACLGWYIQAPELAGIVLLGIPLLGFLFFYKQVDNLSLVR